MKHAPSTLAFALILLLLSTASALAEIEFTEHVVDDDFSGAQDVCSADMDLDGDKDIVACGYYSNQIVLYECMGLFTYESHVIDFNCGGGWCVETVDLNDDGYMDILAAAFLGDEVCWYENDGNMNFTEHFIMACNGPESARPVDLDQDGDLDVLVADFLGDAVKWAENNGDMTWTLHLITGMVDNPCFLDPADLDDDGDLDILVATREGDTIIWLENDGAQSFAMFTIAGYYPGARCVFAEDMDGDGDLDALCVAQDGGTIDWFEHTLQMDWPQHPIETSLAGAWYAMPTDMDDDGDWDVVGSAYIDNRVSWWENDGTSLGWTEHVVSNTFVGASGIRACDVDQDGYFDILGAAYMANEIIVWEQTQSPVVIDISPATEPTIVQRGQAFVYDLSIESFVENPVTGYLWTSAILPSGNTFGPVYTALIPFAPGMTINVTQIQQFVPNIAPLGEYQWVANIGPNPGADPYVFDSFPFTVVESTSAEGLQQNREWLTNGEQRILSALKNSQALLTEATVPESFVLAVAPNPFNARTTLTIDLPESAELTVAVYNVTGQKVAELAQGSYSAGSHILTFDASHLAGGIYFVRASAEQWNEVRKIALLK